MKIRIAIQEIKANKYKHKHNIVLETDNITEIIKRIREELKLEIRKREEELLQYINNRQKSMYKRIAEETDKDLIDWKSKGKDITKEQYIENEIKSELLEWKEYAKYATDLYQTNMVIAQYAGIN